ncbi:hypothetical protein QQP08_012679 [Theobroma cacao]|nr:hypothetical protein QQP08_012679 [Theobroma cacao]
MEKVALRSSSTRAKIIGTIASMSGASVVVLYKGPEVQQPLGSSQSKWECCLVGSLLKNM